MTSLSIATIEQSMELKSIQALRIEELIGTTPSYTLVISTKRLPHIL
ncbi:hypothetical protein STENM36S_08614 [Streptomyces tendae]